jgi:hypothetical protein
MAAGEGDWWAKDIADRLAGLDGPVWLAFHHEPENDGDIKAWTAMQERLAPIVRERAPNVAYTVILTGWNQVYGAPRYHLPSLWPDTRIDILGIDPYNKYGVIEGGRPVREHTDFRKELFEPVHRFAAAHGATWAIAETGYTDAAHADEPHWMKRTYRALVAEGGVAFTYFNSTANSIADWTLDTPQQTEAFAEILADAPTLDGLLSGEDGIGATARTTPGRCR